MSDKRFTVRVAQKGDALCILKLIQGHPWTASVNNTQDAVEYAVKNSQFCVVAVDDKGKIIGFVACFFDGFVAIARRLAVSLEWADRKVEIAKAMLQLAIDRLHIAFGQDSLDPEKGVRLQYLADPGEQVELGLALGFEVVEVNGEPALLMGLWTGSKAQL
ncbi:hypothetical protein JNK13_07530 [bacterium]|nr:hypothetical protein [bacterium]